MFPFRCQYTCEQTIYLHKPFSRRRNRKRLAPLWILMFCTAYTSHWSLSCIPLVEGKCIPNKPSQPHGAPSPKPFCCWLMQSHPSPFRVPPRGSSRLGRLALEGHHDPQLCWSCPAVSGSEAVGRRAIRSHPKGVLNAPNASPQAISKGRDESTVIGGCSMFTEWEVTDLKRYQRPHQPHNLHLNEYLQTAPNSHLDGSFRHLR